MINLSELRIGNYIMYNPPQGSLHGPFIITEINSEWVGYEKGNGFSELFIDQPRLPLCWCEPCAITDEWLQQFGLNSGTAIWQANGGVFKLKLYKNMIRDGSGRFDGVTFSQIVGPTEHHIHIILCRYIHELQNAYSLLTKSELKLIQ